MVMQGYWGGLDGVINKGCSNEKSVYTAWPDSPPSWAQVTNEVEGSQVVDGRVITYNGKYNQTLYGCIAHTSPWMTQTPPQQLTALMFSIAVAFISWPIQPMAMQRVMVAKDGKAVKSACA